MTRAHVPGSCPRACCRERPALEIGLPARIPSAQSRAMRPPRFRLRLGGCAVGGRVLCSRPSAMDSTQSDSPRDLPRVSVVIPVINAAAMLPPLFEALSAQERRPDEVVLVDSSPDDATRRVAEQVEGVRVVPIRDFSHGRARNLGVAAARGDIVVLMTQDALPQGPHWLANLLRPFEDPKVAAAYSRQVPRSDASPMERFFLQERFPDGSPVRREKRPGEKLTLEAVFFSNVSAAVRRGLALAHPFDETLIMSEDQQLSRDLLEAGYAVAYQPDSVVLHSHRYSLLNVLRRYFDSAYSLTLIFPSHDMGVSVSMGTRYLRAEAMYVLTRHPFWIPYYVCYTAAKSAGTLLGHFADRLPRWVLRRVSLHAYHWQ